MQIYKTRLGEIQVDEENVITFQQGLPGFADLKRFAILPSEESNPVKFLQSLEETDISFAIINPKLFFPDYQPELSALDLQELDLVKTEDALVFVIMVITKDPKQITANLLAPVVINPHNKLAKQIVMIGDRYTTRHRVFSA